MAVISLFFGLGAGQVYSQSDSDMQEISQATIYLEQIGSMADACANKAVYDPSIIDKCMSVVIEFNNHMEELFASYGSTINSIFFG